MSQREGRQGRSVGLIIAVVAVAACALLLWMIMRSGDDGASAGTAQEPAAPGAPGGRTAPRAEGSPSLPQVAAAEQGRREPRGTDRPSTETVVNGVRIRDHRRDRSKPLNLPDLTPQSRARKIDAKVTREINERLQPIVRECGASVPPEARGGKPRVEGQLLVTIKDRQVTISGITVEISNVVGASLEPAKQCIQQKALGVTMPPVDEDDLESYPVQLSYPLP